jgi:hypothetical protein
MALGDVPLTPIIDTVTGSVTEIGRIFLRTLTAAVGALAPIDATYWVSRGEGVLTAEVNLGALASGYLKLATAVGIATPTTVATIPQSDVTGLTAALAGKANAPVTPGDVVGLPAALALKADLASPAFTGTPSTPQLAFPAVQVPSAGANVLDDYEEGAWTPTLGGTATYGAQTGLYTKIGRLVHVYVRLVVGTLGTGSTSLISGLPFPVGAGGQAAFSVGYWQVASAYASVGAYAQGSQIVMTGNPTIASAMTNAAPVFSDGAVVIVSGVYMV